MGGFIMLHGKEESFSKMAELLEMKENKVIAGTCTEIAIISNR
jgi:hypothetical protein